MTLTRDERLASVGPLIIDRAKLFWLNLSSREQANYDLEDIVLEVWAELASKDHLYSPERGRYTTYTMDLAWKFLSGLRNIMRTVHAPRNADSRLKSMNVESITAKAIVAAMKEPCRLDDTASEESGETEEERNNSDFMAETMRKLEEAVLVMGRTNPKHALVIHMSYGLNGSEPMNTSEIGETIGMHGREVLAIKKEAEEILGRDMYETAHPREHEHPILDRDALDF